VPRGRGEITRRFLQRAASRVRVHGQNIAVARGKNKESMAFQRPHRVVAEAEALCSLLRGGGILTERTVEAEQELARLRARGALLSPSEVTDFMVRLDSWADLTPTERAARRGLLARAASL
jgi:hypothetical protein